MRLILTSIVVLLVVVSSVQCGNVFTDALKESFKGIGEKLQAVGETTKTTFDHLQLAVAAQGKDILQQTVDGGTQLLSTALTNLIVNLFHHQHTDTTTTTKTRSVIDDLEAKLEQVVQSNKPTIDLVEAAVQTLLTKFLHYQTDEHTKRSSFLDGLKDFVNDLNAKLNAVAKTTATTFEHLGQAAIPLGEGLLNQAIQGGTSLLGTTLTSLVSNLLHPTHTTKRNSLGDFFKGLFHDIGDKLKLIGQTAKTTGEHLVTALKATGTDLLLNQVIPLATNLATTASSSLVTNLIHHPKPDSTKRDIADLFHEVNKLTSASGAFLKTLGVKLQTVYKAAIDDLVSLENTAMSKPLHTLFADIDKVVSQHKNTINVILNAIGPNLEHFVHDFSEGKQLSSELVSTIKQLGTEMSAKIHPHLAELKQMVEQFGSMLKVAATVVKSDV